MSINHQGNSIPCNTGNRSSPVELHIWQALTAKWEKENSSNKMKEYNRIRGGGSQTEIYLKVKTSTEWDNAEISDRQSSAAYEYQFYLIPAVVMLWPHWHLVAPLALISPVKSGGRGFKIKWILGSVTARLHVRITLGIQSYGVQSNLEIVMLTEDMWWSWYWSSLKLVSNITTLWVMSKMSALTVI